MVKRKINKTKASDTLLVELLTEELPPKTLKRLSEEFADSIAQGLRARGLTELGSRNIPFATPRRLAVRITSVLAKGKDEPIEQKLMPLSIASTPDGKASDALRKKLSGLGRSQLANSFPDARDGPDSLIIKSDGKVDCVYLHSIALGQPLVRALDEILEGTINSINIAKVMTYQLANGQTSVQFARPVRGLVALYGSNVVEVSLLGLDAKRVTQGHRFLSHGQVTIKHADEYEQALLNAQVVPRFETRLDNIINKIKYLCGNSRVPVASDALYDEITALVEAPAVYEGQFGAEFLKLPEECLILSMQQHQKYVPLRDKATGKLLPCFLFVSNIEARQPGEIIHGNERVLRARLSDAKFFFEQDRKVSLDDRVLQLAHVIYHNKIGRQLEQVERIRALSSEIARILGFDASQSERAAWLCKVDLLTDMVGEFPELQGIMGRYYALDQGETAPVAQAIEEHYKPRFAGDSLPLGNVSVSISLADKILSITALFCANERPTGEKDPFGLRRQALGIARMIVELKLPLNLLSIIVAASKTLTNDLFFKSTATEILRKEQERKKYSVGLQATAVGHSTLPVSDGVITDIYAFILDRLRSYLRDKGYTSNEVEAVLFLKPDRLDLVVPKLEAVREFQKLPEAEGLAAANKRIRNILKNAPSHGQVSLDRWSGRNWENPSEAALFNTLQRVGPRVIQNFELLKYREALVELAQLKGSIDKFFDDVLVMAEDPETRESRLDLLRTLDGLMNQVADISKLAA